MIQFNSMVHKQACLFLQDKIRSRFACLLFAILFLPLLAGAAFRQTAQPTHAMQPPEYTFKIIQVFPHDRTAFTQGLIYHDGFFYEGTGLNGQSSLRKVRMDTGTVVQYVDLDPQYFGEGITLFKNEIVQLTWQSHKGFVYSLSDFRLLRQFSYPGEGWGLTTGGNEIFMSDGTAEIRVLDGATLKEKRRLKVRDGSTAVTELNELEFVEGEIFANIWQTNRIARISPQTGRWWAGLISLDC